MPPLLRPITIALSASALVAGCAGDSGKYPSLAIRDAERVSGEFSPAPPAAPDPVAPVASNQEIGSIAARARETHRTFLSEQPAALQLAKAARGAGVESNDRSRAEVALSVLTTLRSETQLAMADLDVLEARAAGSFAPTDGIAAAQIQIASLLAEQDEMLSAVIAELGG